jgi:hypothetical protein
MQFGLDGQVNRWATRSAWSWFMLPTIATAVGALMFALAAAAPKYPALFNYPGKEDVLKLSGEPRAAAILEVQRFMLWLGVATVAVFGAAVYSMYETAFGRATTSALLVSVGVLTIGTPVLLAVMSSRINRIVDANKPPRASVRR